MSEIHNGQEIREYLGSPHIGSEPIDVTGIAQGAAGPQGPQGIPGLDGKTIRSGAVNPTASDGVNGDFWINTATWTIFGPKLAGTWGAGTSLVGPTGAIGPSGTNGTPGAVWRTGAGLPAGSLGIVGDFYINTNDGRFYEKTGQTTYTQRGQFAGGSGVPAGGTTGQVLAKASGSDGDVTWTTVTGGSGGGVDPQAFPVTFCVPISLESLTPALVNNVARFRAPFPFTLTSIRLGASTNAASFPLTVDIRNGAGTSIMGTQKLTVPVGSATSLANPTQPTLNITTFADDELISFDVTNVGGGVLGAKVWLIGTRSLTGGVTVPGQVSGLSATRGNTQVALSWTAPSTGGSAITAYDVQRSLDGSTGWTTVGTVSGTTFTNTGLTNGVTYHYRVRALNSIGYGAFSSTVTGTPATVPSAPAAPTLGTITSNGMTATWTAPANGGSVITSYLVEWKLTSTGSWAGAANASVTGLTHNITGLAASSSYDVRVTAINAVGSSTPSSAATASTTAGSSSATFINALTANSTSGSASVSSSSLGVASGDLLIAIVAGGAGRDLSGFTPINSVTDGIIDYGYQWFSKVATGSEPANYTATADVGEFICLAVICIRNASVVDRNDFTYSDVFGATSTNVTAPSVTPTASGMLITYLGVTSSASIPSTPSGMTSRLTLTNANQSFRVSTEDVGASATGTRTGTVSPAEDGRMGLTIVVR